MSLDTSLGGETYKRDQSKAGQAGSGMARNSGSDLYLRCSLSDGFRWRTALETLTFYMKRGSHKDSQDSCKIALQ